MVVAGANGGGNTSNNTTAAQMASQLGLADTSFYNNVLPYSDAGSVYLGWANTTSGPRAYLLSAMHINLSSTMLINAVSYTVTRQSIADSDLALLTLANVDGIMPSLPVVNLATVTPAVGTGVIMAGFGRQRVQNATTNADTSDAVAVTDGTGYSTTAPQVKRWGTNQTVKFNATGPASPTGTIFHCGSIDHDFFHGFRPAGFRSMAGQQRGPGRPGDSGGGVFGFDGTLYGIVAAVSGTDVTDAAFGRNLFRRHRHLQNRHR